MERLNDEQQNDDICGAIELSNELANEESGALLMLKNLPSPRTLDDFIRSCGFDASSKSPSFFWFEHCRPGKGINSVIAKAFDLSPDEVSDEEAHFFSYLQNC